VDLSTGFGLLGAGGIVALIGVLLTVRESRQRRYDERIDKRTGELETRNRELEDNNDKLMEEQTRLRVLLRSHGIDPDSPARIV
jgi:hypothetical protein